MPVSSRKLPEFLGQKQEAYSTYNSAKKGDKNPEKMRKEVEKQKDFVLQMLMKTMQNQLPNIGGDSSSGNNDMSKTMMETTMGMAQFDATERNSENVSRLCEKMDNSMTTALGFQGQKVSYDDSIRSYNGKTVAFDFQLKFHGSTDDNARAQVNVRVLDENGQIVRTDKILGQQGKNSYSWNGKDNKGKEVEQGKYSIQVNAVDPANKSAFVEVFTLLNGVVKAITVEAGQTKLMLDNGKVISQDQVVKAERLQDIEDVKPSYEEYVQYIGKNVEIDLSKVEVKNGKGDIICDNTVKNPGKVTVQIYQGTKFIKNIEYENKLPEGISYLQLDAKKHGISDGTYQCQITVEDKDNEDQKVPLGTKQVAKVSGLDLESGEIITQEQHKFPVSNVIKLASNKAELPLITKGGFYVGKQVEFTNNEFKFSGANFEVDLRIPKPPVGRRIDDAELQIYQGKGVDKKLVQRVQVPAVGLYNQEVEPVPTFTGLNLASRHAVNLYIRENLRLPGVNGYNGLTREEKIAVNQVIEKKFRAGELFRTGQVHNDPAAKYRNMGVNKLQWDGTKMVGPNAVNDEEFSYEIVTSTCMNDNSDKKISRIINTDTDIVSSAEVVDGEIHLVLSSGYILPLGEVKGVRG